MPTPPALPEDPGPRPVGRAAGYPAPVEPTPASTRRGTLRPISVAPMMDRTDRHFRWLMRQISHHALLHTEMVTTGALLHGPRECLLAHDPAEHPVALQIGGDDPAELATCARFAEDHGYDEVDLNVGCPSSRVRTGGFGVVLMRRPGLVAEAVAAMREAVSIPVTVKHRIGVDHDDSYAFLARFVETVAEAGCDRFTVHARKAWLQGLSPKENRTVPPLRYADVHRLKREHPHLAIEINGGLGSIDAYREQLQAVDAVMVGRAAYDDPWHFVQVDPVFFDAPAPASTRAEVAGRLADYVDRRVARGDRALGIVRHAFGLYAGVPGAGAWRRTLAEGCKNGGGDGDTVREALASVETVRARMRRAS